MLVKKLIIDRHGNHYVRNTVVYATSALHGVISAFYVPYLWFMMTNGHFSSHCPWVWNCGG